MSPYQNPREIASNEVIAGADVANKKALAECYGLLLKQPQRASRLVVVRNFKPRASGNPQPGDPTYYVSHPHALEYDFKGDAPAWMTHVGVECWDEQEMVVLTGIAFTPSAGDPDSITAYAAFSVNNPTSMDGHLAWQVHPSGSLILTRTADGASPLMAFGPGAWTHLVTPSSESTHPVE